ncbi:hypothetical protein L4C36_05475 [Photobacterium japonica]|uniref:hypothetical protein n=1 Tax=Photobacterium japonica TaxID=2910235 RepID=UPI003D0CB1FB
MLLLLPALALLGFYFYFNGTAGLNRACLFAVTLMAAYCVVYFWPPMGLAYRGSNMGAVFYGLPLGAFGLLLWAGDMDASQEGQWVGGVLGALGLVSAIALLLYFKFSYWPSF